MNRPWKRYLANPAINALGRRKEQKCFSRAPILIGGCARSGTSLLLSMLSAHPHIHAFAHEVDAFTEWEEKNGNLMPTRIDRMYRRLLTSNISDAAHRWCEKRPYNVHFIKEILAYFGPESRFIHIMRDPRAVCTSIHPEQPDDFWVEPDRWVDDVSAGWKQKDNSQVLTIKYEDLIESQDLILSKICHFIDEPYVHQMENWFDFATVRTNRAWFDELKMVHRDGLEKWKSSTFESRIEKIMSNVALRELMEKLNYQ